ncbi:hypothetical protein PN838_13475 [Psychrosphaera sp. G1-22]|uniref:Uncharacterized protein n=1 Tax=Psychrosphaera algicola TaxID=3023714 RepID=A0ABT5FDK6_9GAMM|nr:hypothetical protein [Psychrosphaera sp. G1-22]MDC2889602.1 hypothetical protein [Psychrosphaera sp. G1-22]
MPILAIYGQELSGVTPMWIGLAIGAYGLTHEHFFKYQWVGFQIVMDVEE